MSYVFKHHQRINIVYPNKMIFLYNQIYNSSKVTLMYEITYEILMNKIVHNNIIIASE